MIANLKNIFKVPDLRNKILFTLLIVALYRVGAAIRVPGVDPIAIDQLQEGAQNGALGLFNLFSSSAFFTFSIFRTQRHTVHHSQHHHAGPSHRHPPARELQSGGTVGQRGVAPVPRAYVTVGLLAALQATLLMFLSEPASSRHVTLPHQCQAPSVPLLDNKHIAHTLPRRPHARRRYGAC